MTLRFPEFDPVEDKYMALALYYRGVQRSRDVNKTVGWMKQTHAVSFVEWCPTGIKTDVDGETMGEVEGPNVLEFPDSKKSVTMVGNNIAVSRVFTRNCKKYDMMYSQRAYVHQYVAEGMEE